MAPFFRLVQEHAGPTWLSPKGLGPACNAEQLRCKAERRLRHRNAETASTFGIRPLRQSTRSAGGHCNAIEHLCNADATTLIGYHQLIPLNGTHRPCAGSKISICFSISPCCMNWLSPPPFAGSRTNLTQCVVGVDKYTNPFFHFVRRSRIFSRAKCHWSTTGGVVGGWMPCRGFSFAIKCTKLPICMGWLPTRDNHVFMVYMGERPTCRIVALSHTNFQTTNYHLVAKIFTKIFVNNFF